MTWEQLGIAATLATVFGQAFYRYFATDKQNSGRLLALEIKLENVQQDVTEMKRDLKTSWQFQMRRAGSEAITKGLGRLEREDGDE